MRFCPHYKSAHVNYLKMIPYVINSFSRGIELKNSCSNDSEVFMDKKFITWDDDDEGLDGDDDDEDDDDGDDEE